MGRGMPFVPPCPRPARNRRLIFRGGRHVLGSKGGRVVDPGGLGSRLVGKVRRRVVRRAEILRAIGRHLASERREARQRKASRDEHIRQLICMISPPTAPFLTEIGAKGECQFSVSSPEPDQRLLAPIWATALISTLSEGSASAATCTRVEVGKLPVKNSRRARHTFSRWVMSVTKIVTLTISAMLPPAASTR